jgi:hypothetical protein
MMKGKAVMPVQVRTFWWISIAIATYSIALTVLAVRYIQVHDFLPTMPRLSPEVRLSAYHVDLFVRIVSTAIWCGLILCLAWLTVFRRLNWARWGSILILLARVAYELWGAIVSHQLNGSMLEVVQSSWWAYVILILAVAAAVCIFSGRSEEWFESSR